MPDLLNSSSCSGYRRSQCLPTFCFSTCGTIAFILCNPTEQQPVRYYHIVHRLDVNPVCPRILVASYLDYEQQLCSSERHIQLSDDLRNSLTLIMTRPFQGDSWQPFNDPTARLLDVALYPLHLRDTTKTLLLGENDDTKMRLLCAPNDGSTPEIIPVSLTFNEALSRLNAEYDRLMAARNDEESVSG